MPFWQLLTITTWQHASWESFWEAFMTKPTDSSEMSSRQKTYANHLKHALSVIDAGELVAG
jgi:hypothetical protein